MLSILDVLFAISATIIGYYETTPFDEFRVPIHSSRIVVVPESNSGNAQAILGLEQTRVLNAALLGRLLNVAPDSSSQMIEQQLNDVKSFARRLENSKFADGENRELAEANWNFASYLRGIPDKLVPVLMSALADRNADARDFSVVLEGSLLKVLYSTTGAGPQPSDRVFIVIFVERPVSSVELSVGGSE